MPCGNGPITGRTLHHKLTHIMQVDTSSLAAGTKVGTACTLPPVRRHTAFVCHQPVKDARHGAVTYGTLATGWLTPLGRAAPDTASRALEPHATFLTTAPTPLYTTGRRDVHEHTKEPAAGNTCRGARVTGCWSEQGAVPIDRDSERRCTQLPPACSCTTSTTEADRSHAPLQGFCGSGRTDDQKLQS
jgi:hypothetical protein